MIKFLIVDDEPDVEILMKQRFRTELREGVYQFVFAYNGVEALKVLSEDSTISIVLTDINMPEMDGLTLLRHIQQDYPYLFTIVISAYGDMENIRTAMNLGSFDFITKPIDFEDLKKTIKKTIERLQAFKLLKKQQDIFHNMVRELHVARDIQESIIPKDYIQNETVQLFGSMQPAKQVGGDFYDFFWYDQDNLGFVIGDVSGKGMPSALFMTVARTLIRAYSKIYSDPSICLFHVNNFLCTNNFKMMFVTVFFGILNTKTGEVVAVNAGHNNPVLVHKNKCDYISAAPQLALGIMTDTDFVSLKFTIKKGETLFLYTDGVTEAENAEGELFRESRLSTYLEAHSSQSCVDLIQGLSLNLRVFSAGIDQSDDITMLAISYKGNSNG